MSNFAFPVAIRPEANQELLVSLLTRLKALGYTLTGAAEDRLKDKDRILSITADKMFLVTNFMGKPDHVGFSLGLKPYDRTLLEPHQTDLFLALAAARTEGPFQVGEWVKRTFRLLPNNLTMGKLYLISHLDPPYIQVVNDQGKLERTDPLRFARPSKEELLAQFSQAAQEPAPPARKLLGYRSPMDLFAGAIPAGTLYTKRTDFKAGQYQPTVKNGSAVYTVPEEIVETWEPVYEPDKHFYDLTAGRHGFITNYKVEYRPAESMLVFENGSCSLADLEAIVNRYLQIQSFGAGDYEPEEEAMKAVRITFAPSCRNRVQVTIGNLKELLTWAKSKS